MKQLSFIFLILVLFSCKDNSNQAKIEYRKEQERQKNIVAQLEKIWIFEEEPFTPEVQSKIVRWNAWRNFVIEIHDEPHGTLRSFQKKTEALAIKAQDLNQNIPAEYNKPSVKSRVSVLLTKIRLLDLYINLHKIPMKKVATLVNEVNSDLSSLQFQIETINARNSLPKEDGEDFIKMMDTTRAAK